MVTKLVHLVMFDLHVLPAQPLKDRKLASLSRPFCYGGCHPCLASLIHSGEFLIQRDLEYIVSYF